uniref:G-protein coupled receptors family 1 profile domain-containing protein n=1 Tax=Panagrolaimus superbus TaxID=310955 RepID=A0A914YRU1_9BILA
MDLKEIDKRCSRGLKSNITKEAWENEPFSDKCLQNFFNEMNIHLRPFSEWESTLYTTIYAIISIFAIVGNGVVILAVIRKKDMRTNRNVLIVNLALSNLMLALTTIPFLWLPSMSFDFPYSNFFCKFANALPGSNIYCSTLTISVMAIDSFPLLVYYNTSMLYVFKDVWVYDEIKNVTSLKSYGWRQCRLEPSKNLDESEDNGGGGFNETRTIQVCI